MATAKTWLGQKDRRARLRKIQTLDPGRDYREIAKLFYEDFGTVALLQAFSGNLFTFSAPRMSRILSSTGEFEQRVAKRFLDTALLARLVMNHGLDSPGPGRDAARRVNSMHRRYEINPDDFVAVGVDNALMAADFASRFGWRPVTAIEREALGIFYTHETRHFGGRTPLPATLAEMHSFHERYMEEQLAFEPQNRRLADALTGFAKTLFPVPLRYGIVPLLRAQIDPRILRACGTPVPGPLVRVASWAFFRLLGKADPAPDNQPDGLQKLIDEIYPNGYSAKTLGTHLQATAAGRPKAPPGTGSAAAQRRPKGARNPA